MEILKENIDHNKLSIELTCGCDYCECSCDSDTLLPEDK